MIFDLSGTGIALTSLDQSQAHFDFGADGFREKTGWVGEGQGILIRDPGDLEPVKSEHIIGSTGGNGFYELTSYDSNGDGFIDSGDSAFASLSIWVDGNGDGISSAAEIFSLDELGITKINLAAQASGVPFGGNTIVSTSSFTMLDSTTNQLVEREMVQVDFLTDTQLSREELPEDMVYSGLALILPQIDAYGLLSDFRVAASLNNGLALTAKQLVLNSSSLSSTDFEARFIELVEKWADIDGVERDSAGDFIDARHLALVYKYFGIDPQVATGYPTHPNAALANQYEGLYQGIIASMEARFVSQIAPSLWHLGASSETVNQHPFTPFVLFQYDPNSDQLNGDLDLLVAVLKNQEPTDPLAREQYWDKATHALVNLRLDIYDGNEQQFLSRFVGAANLSDYSSEIVQAFIARLAPGISFFDSPTVEGFIGTNGSDVIYGDGSSTVLIGGGGDDHIVGQEGNDTIISGDGTDTIYYARGDGNDTITEAGYWDADDRLVLSDINPADVTLVRNDNDVTLVIAESATGAGDGGSILLKGNLNEYLESGLDTIAFADGTTWTRDTMRAALLAQAPTSGNDVINGFNVADIINGGDGNDTINAGDGNDLITGGHGNDVISGGYGNDSYYYSRGDGNDTIAEDGLGNGNADKLVFTGVNASDVTLVRNGNNVTLVIAESAAGAGDGGSVLIKTALDDYYDQGIETITFADGTTWTRNTIRVALLAQASTSGNDVINGFNVADIINGGDGNDTINAGDGNDLITGGHGNDVISGGYGNDSYYYSRGDGNDTIAEDGLGNGNADKLVFTGVNASDVTLVRNGNNVTLVIAESAAGAGDGGSVLIKTALDDYYDQGIETITFADGTTWTRNTIRVALLAQASTSGNDVINGFNVADIINGGDGNDTINAGAGDDLITGGHGNDVISGGYGNDTYFYTRGDGNDTIAEDGLGNGNADKLVFTGVNASDVTLVRNGNDVTLVIAESAAGAGDGGSVLIKTALDDYYDQGIETITFADGTSWDRATLRMLLVNYAGTSANDTIIGSNVADIINGGDGNDTINAGAGDDLITGGHGNDVISGGYGNDTYFYTRGDGNDTIAEDGLGNGNADKLVFTGVNASDVTLVRNGNNVTLVIAESAAGAGDGGSVLIKTALDDYYDQGIETITFADGTTWTRNTIRVALLAQASTSGNDVINGFNVADIINGGDGNDTINAGAGDDLITGGHGNDVISGGYGNDTYFYTRGDGNDTIAEDGLGNGNADKLVFTGVNASDVTLVRNGNDVTLVIAESAAGAGDGGSVLIKTALDDYYDQGIETITFADGTTWTRNTIRVALLAQASTSGNDVINGFNVADIINGGDGNDTINAGAGDDLITGGHGNDVISGGYGNDTYFYTRGDGNDTIAEDGLGNGNADKLVFTGVNASDVMLVRNGNNVTLVIAESAAGAGDGGSVLIKTALDDYYDQGIETITFADGTTWTRNTIRVALLAQASTSGNDVINGFNVADIINGGDGNDTINAGAGDDLITGGHGNDVISGGYGNDTYFYTRGDGNDTIAEDGLGNGNADKLVFTGVNASDVTLVRNGNDVTLVIAESAAGAGDGGSVLIKTAVTDYYDQGIETITFADGTSWDRANIRSHISYVGGTPGNDTITGTSGADSIHAGAGDDTLIGLAGDDVFVFRSGFGHDTINDFVAGAQSADVIDISNGIFADFAAVMAAATQVGADTLITYDASNSILLKNVGLTTLHQDDFRFTTAA
ncbi:beta strand repeat-containing protein [Rhizobium sp. F40D2]